MNGNNNNQLSTKSKISSFIKYYWINIIIFLTVIIILIITLLSIINETRTHFQLSKITSILENQVFVKPSTLLPTIKSIEEKQRISLICNTFILAIDFILFVFLCTLILKRNFISNKITNLSNILNNKNQNNIEEREGLISNNNQFYQNQNQNQNNLVFPFSSNSNNLNNNLNNNNYFNNTYERGSIICESPIYQPWNMVTIENVSSDDSMEPFPKIKMTYYRYGTAAGKIMFDRFINQLNNEEKDEICRLLGIIIHNNNS